jgi:enoyl-CoA hydratase/carnithine racemase
VTLRLEPDGSTVHLVIDRPQKANAVTEQMWDDLPDLIGRAEAMPGARVLVLESSAPTVFCAGADVEEYRAHAGDPGWGQANHERVTRATDALHRSSLATVAAVAGACAGGGVALVTACDLRIAAENASFSVPPARLGLVYPQQDTARLVDLVGGSGARFLLLTAARVDAAWALRSRLVDEVVSAEDLADRVAAVAGAIASNAGVSVRAMKRTVELALAGTRAENEETRALLREALGHADHEEGTAAFLDRRPPRFG